MSTDLFVGQPNDHISDQIGAYVAIGVRNSASAIMTKFSTQDLPLLKTGVRVFNDNASTGDRNVALTGRGAAAAPAPRLGSQVTSWPVG